MTKDVKYYETLDKRSREYREYKKFHKGKTPKGLGDTVEKILNSKPIKPITKVIKKIIWNDKEDCGCNERKDYLNKLIPYNKRKVVRCFSKQDYDNYTEYQKERTLKKISRKHVKLLIDLYAKVYAIQYDIRRLCSSCKGSTQIVLKISKELDKVHKSYGK